MSEATSAGTREGAIVGDEYAEKRAAIEESIEWIDDKLENGRIRNPEHARARQGYLRLKIQAIGEWRKLKEAGDLAELREEIEKVKEERGVDS